MSEMSQRIRYIDFLKLIGLGLIMLAHVSSTPELIQMIRCFDVPLMVIVSGLLACGSFKRRYPDGKCGVRYFWSRFKRLVFPTWIFLAFYFLLLAAIGRVESLQYYLASFGLTRYGVGYVWIILIYLFCALMIPAIHYFSKKKSWLLIVLILYAVDEILYYFGVGENSLVVQNTLYYIIPYGLITALGYNYRSMSNFLKFGIVLISCLVVVACGLYYYKETGDIQSVRIAKYPPRLYFVSWGVLASFLLLGLVGKYDLKIYQNHFVEFVSRHSLWIYLWHILYVTILNHTPISRFWWAEFILLIALSSITVWAQNFIVDKIEAKRSWRWLTYFKY